MLVTRLAAPASGLGETIDSGLVPPFDVSSLTVYRIASSKHEGSGFAQEAVLTGPTSGPEERQARDQPTVHSSSRSKDCPWKSGVVP